MKIRDCVTAAARAFGVDPSRFYGEQRAREIAWPRIAAMWLAYVEGGFSSGRIAQHLHRDGSTVRMGWRRAEQLAEADEEFADRLQLAWLYLNGWERT